MATLLSEKIFIDPKEELSFIVDKILRTEKEQIILIVPQNSVLFSNILTLKILYRHLIEKSKLLIVVTEDRFGTSISQKAGFVVVKKVSQITSDLWEVAKAKQESYTLEKQELKNSLLEKRSEPKSDGIDLSLEEDASGELHKKDEQNVSENSSKKDVEENKNKNESKYFEGFKPEKAESTVKTVGSLKILSGGDIERDQKSAKIDKLNKFDSMSDGKKEVKDNIFSQKKFTGRDLTRSVPNSAKGGFLGNLFKFGKKDENPEDRLGEKKKIPFYKRKVLIFAGVIFLLLLIISYFVVFRWSNIEVDVTLKEDEALFTETIEGEFDREELDPEDKIIPVERRSETKSKSATADATGSAKTGNKASGTVYMINTLEGQDINLQAGTRITSNTNQRTFVLTNGATLPAPEFSVDGTILNTSRVDDVSVEAVEIGEDYNLEGTSSDTRFTVEGYSQSDIEVRRDDDFTGGSSEEITVVSESNVESLSNSLRNDLEQELRDDLEIPNGFQLIEESIKYEDEQVESVPSIGEELESGTFDLSLSLSISAVIVRESDLEEMVSFTLQSEDENVQTQITDLSDIEISNFIDNEGNIFFDIEGESKITNQLSVDDIKNRIMGKSFSSIKDTLREDENITEVETKFNPGAIPSFLQRVPNNSDRITIRFK